VQDNITIRNVEINDAEAILRIYAHYINATAITFECIVPSLDAFRNRIEEFSKDYPYIVALYKGEIVGYAYAHAYYGRDAFKWSVETSIYMDGQHRRKGAGRQLYTALETRLKSEGFKNMYACIASPLGDDPYLDEGSIAFHKKMGFHVCGHFNKCGYKFKKWYDVVWMEKIIGKHN